MEPVLMTVPMIGTCDDFTLKGIGYPKDKDVEVLRLPDREVLLEGTTQSSGAIEIAVPGSLLEGCGPGVQYSFEVEGARATYRIFKPGDLMLNPASGSCATEVTINGSDFPANADVDIRASVPGSDNYVVIATTHTNDAGRLELRITMTPPLPPAGCGTGELSITAVGEDFGIWSAIYEYAEQ